MAKMKEMDQKESRRFFTGFRSVSRLIEAYQPEDMAAWSETERLFKRGKIEEAMDTDDLPIMLAGNADLHLQAGYKQLEQPWRQVFGTRSYDNFREQKIADLLEIETDDETGNTALSNTLPEVPENHGYSEAVLSEYYELAQIYTYGVTFSLSRQMLTNDTLGRFQTLTVKLGNLVARTVNAHVNNCLEADASTTNSGPSMVDGFKLFNIGSRATDNMTSAALPLSHDNVVGEYPKFAAQQAPNGFTNDELGIYPKFLVVPTALRFQADYLCSQASVRLIGAPASNTLEPDLNVLAGQLVPVCLPGLSSAVDWYLAAAPADCGTIDVAYLNGRQEPSLFVQQEGMHDLSDADGIKYKVRHDWDVFPVTYHGMRKVDDTT